MAAAKDGMTAAQVRALLGEPFAVQSYTDFAAANEALRSFELPFVDTDNLDEVWLYLHRQRGKLVLKHQVRTYLGFQKGVLHLRWQIHDPTKPPDGDSEKTV